MTDKVKLTQRQADTLQIVVASRIGGAREVLMEHGNYCVPRGSMKDKDPYWEGPNACLNAIDFDTLAKALYAGYEVELTPEDRLREYYDYDHESADMSLRQVRRHVIKSTLDLLGIKIEGVNA